MDEDQTTSPAPSAPPPQTAPVTASVAAPVTASAAPSSLDELQQSIRALFPNGAAAEPASTGSAQRFPAGSIQDTIVQAAQQHGVSPALMLALGESESSFNPNAVSPTGPRGLFQFTRKTAAAYGVDPDDPVSSARGAAAYMNDLLKQTGGDTEAALKLYKGFAQGGATQKHINHTLGLVTKYGGASISDPSVPQVHSAPGQGTQTTQGTEGTPPRDPTDTQTPIGATPDLQSTIASRQPAPPSPEDSANPELQAALRAQFAPAAEEPKTDDVHDIASLSKLISNLGYQGKLNTGPNAYPRMPKLTEPKGPYADRGPLEPAGEWVNRIDTGIANSSPLAALQGVIQSLPGEAVPLRAVGEALNTALGDVPQALLPKTFEKLEEATTSGNPAVDWLVNTGSQGLGFVGSMMVGGAALEATGLPIEGVAKTATLMGLRAAPADAIQVAMGEKNPISALVDVAVVQPTVGALFHGASTIANTPTRIAASGAASGVGYVAGQAVAGEPVTLAGAGEAVGVGGSYGVAGGGHGGGDVADKRPSGSDARAAGCRQLQEGARRDSGSRYLDRESARFYSQWRRSQWRAMVHHDAGSLRLHSRDFGCRWRSHRCVHRSGPDVGKSVCRRSAREARDRDRAQRPRRTQGHPRGPHPRRSRADLSSELLRRCHAANRRHHRGLDAEVQRLARQRRRQATLQRKYACG